VKYLNIPQSAIVPQQISMNNEAALNLTVRDITTKTAPIKLRK
jgi:hypothetical protein